MFYQANFRSPRAERGLLAQLVLFTFLVDDVALDNGPRGLQTEVQKLPPSAAGGCVSATAAGLLNSAEHKLAGGAALASASASEPTNVERLIKTTFAGIVGARVAAAIVDRRRLMEVKSMLKATASPFIPTALR